MATLLEKTLEGSSSFHEGPSDFLSLADDSLYVEVQESTKASKMKRLQTTDGVLEGLMHDKNVVEGDEEKKKEDEFDGVWNLLQTTMKEKKQKKERKIKKRSKSVPSSKKLSKSDHGIYRSSDRTSRSGKKKLSSSDHNQNLDALLTPKKSKSKLSDPELNKDIDAILSPRHKAKSKASESERNIDALISISKSAKSRKSKLKLDKDITPRSAKSERKQRSGSKKPSRKSSTRSSKSKTPKSSRRSIEDPPFPSPLPFGDFDEDSATKSPKTKRKSSKTPKLRSSEYQTQISNLQVQIQQLNDEKHKDSVEASKQIQDLKRKAFDAKLDLQKSEIENREMRSQLRDTATNLREAELDILDLEKRLRLKNTKVQSVEDQLKQANAKIKDFEQNALVSAKKKNEALEIALKEKNDMIALLQEELDEASKKQVGGTEDQNATRRELRALRAEIHTLKSKYKTSEERNILLDEDVEHWKKQSFAMEDDLAEVRTQLQYWKAKYKDVVDASKSTKSYDALASSGHYDFESHTQPGRQSSPVDSNGVTALWSKLTTPNQQARPKYGNSISQGQKKYLSKTMH